MIGQDLASEIRRYKRRKRTESDADTQRRLALGERIVEVLKQKRNSPVRVGCQVAIVYAVINGYLDSIPVNEVKEYEISLYEKLEHEYASLLERLESGFYEADDVEELKKALSEMQR
jgi:F-type H+-transporting ATPase subunit alpha